MLPCPIKHCTGYSCPGCGIQRSFYRLIDLDFKNSFIQYPPLLLGIFSVLVFEIIRVKKKVEYKYLIILNLIIIVSNYIYNQFIKHN